jgi:hypothetical protein
VGPGRSGLDHQRSLGWRGSSTVVWISSVIAWPMR